MQAKRALLFFVVFFGGCAAAQVASYVVPPARAGVPTQRWEYQCVSANTGVTEMANEHGREGWEMTSAAGAGGADKMVWCFKRPLP